MLVLLAGPARTRIVPAWLFLGDDAELFRILAPLGLCLFENFLLLLDLLLASSSSGNLLQSFLFKSPLVSLLDGIFRHYKFLPQQFLYFLPDPQGHGSLRPIFLPCRLMVCTLLA